MGLLLKLTDAVLFLFFLVIALAAPAFDAQACLPATAFPELLVSLKASYASHYGDYLMTEKPHFFVGLVWLELLFLWPLCLVNLYALLTGKPWFRTTCLVQGASVFTSMVAIMSELLNSGKASEKLITMYSSFLGFGLLALLRGLVTSSSSAGKRTVVGRKKRA